MGSDACTSHWDYYCAAFSHSEDRIAPLQYYLPYYVVFCEVNVHSHWIGAVRRRAAQRNVTQRIRQRIRFECVDVRCRTTSKCKG